MLQHCIATISASCIYPRPLDLKLSRSLKPNTKTKKRQFYDVIDLSKYYYWVLLLSPFVQFDPRVTLERKCLQTEWRRQRLRTNSVTMPIPLLWICLPYSSAWQHNRSIDSIRSQRVRLSWLSYLVQSLIQTNSSSVRRIFSSQLHQRCSLISPFRIGVFHSL